MVRAGGSGVSGLVGWLNDASVSVSQLLKDKQWSIQEQPPTGTILLRIILSPSVSSTLSFLSLEIPFYFTTYPPGKNVSY